MLALYLTIWLALALFVAGESGRALARNGRAPRWAWWTFTLGLVLALVHTAIAFAVVHNWVHEDAVRATARQTEDVFGVTVGWGVYVNYVFYGAWLADVIWWRRSGNPHTRPAAITWTLRGFYLVIILNAAVIFAVGPRRALGVLMVGWLAAVWAIGSRRASAAEG
jgi:hypothetical protein